MEGGFAFTSLGAVLTGAIPRYAVAEDLFVASGHGAWRCATQGPCSSFSSGY